MRRCTQYFNPFYLRCLVHQYLCRIRYPAETTAIERLEKSTKRCRLIVMGHVEHSFALVMPSIGSSTSGQTLQVGYKRA